MSKWTKREEQTALFLHYNERFSYSKISESLTKYYGIYRSPEAVRKKIRIYEASDLELESLERPIELDLCEGMYSVSQEVDAHYDNYAQIIEIEASYHEVSEDLCGMIGKPRKGRSDYKVMSISDLHLPHVHIPLLRKFMERAKKEADIIQVNGDISDIDAWSYFKATNAVLPIIQFQKTKAIMEILASMGMPVFLVGGNHDARMLKHFLDLVQFYSTPFVHLDMLSMIADGYDVDWEETPEDDEVDEFLSSYGKKVTKNNKPATLVKGEKMDNLFYKNNANNWWVKIGHALFCHADRYLASGPLKTCMAIDQTFQQHPIYYEAIIQAHTHKQGKAILGKKLLMEQGCACHAPAYAAGAKCRYGPQTLGWAEIYLDRAGHVDFNKSHNEYYGSTSSILR